MPGLAADGGAVAQALENLGYPAARTLYFGESLGTSVVAALQAERPPAGMVLPGADHNDPVMFGGQVADAVARLAEHVS